MKNFVFIGDSVTDSDRKRSKKYADTPDALGHGWVRVLASSALENHKLWNRGFSGYRTVDILNEPDYWPEQLERADVATLMIGINDVWQAIKYNRPYDENEVVAQFEQLIKKLKTRTDTLVVMEPVALLVDEVNESWLPLMSSLFSAFRHTADKHQVQWVSLQRPLQTVAQQQLGDYLFDGVHPSDKGHHWISQQWLAQLPTTLWQD